MSREYQIYEANLKPIVEGIPSFARAYDGDISDFTGEQEAAIFVARGILQANADIPSVRGGAASMALFTLRNSGLFAAFSSLDLLQVVRLAERQLEEKRAKQERGQARRAA